MLRWCININGIDVELNAGLFVSVLVNAGFYIYNHLHFIHIVCLQV